VPWLFADLHHPTAAAESPRLRDAYSNNLENSVARPSRLAVTLIQPAPTCTRPTNDQLARTANN
jgi:hypothetical protein